MASLEYVNQLLRTPMSWHYSKALIKDYENSLSSLEPEEESWEESSLDGEQSAPLKLTPMPEVSSWPGKTTDALNHSPSGMTSVPSTVDRGEDVLTWFLEGFPVRTSVPQEKEKESLVNEAVSGKRCPESFAKYDHDTHSWKTHQFLLLGGLELFLETWPRWGMMLAGECWAMGTLAPIKLETGCGLPRRPNHLDGKGFYTVTHESAIKRREHGKRQLMLIHVIGLLAYKHLKRWWANPQFWEAAMGWPIKWTDLGPLEMGKFQQWYASHGIY